MRKINFQKYLLVFLITAGIFAIIFYVSSALTNEKFSRLESLKENLQIDTISLETQFAILESSLCENLDKSFLVSDLYNIEKKLEYMENNLGPTDPEVMQLKKYYSLLEIKHWILVKKANLQCELNLIPILYFYSVKDDCSSCQKQGVILTYLREKYPNLRIYSFDYNLDLSATEALKALYSVEKDLPAIVISNETYYGLQNRDELEKVLPPYEKQEN